ncbi:MAG: hypothetical protein KDD53_04630, partial [Bdellovibrionales bacterium]|nr:hypothetical protein [Bdellovibrionales bacterium]
KKELPPGSPEPMVIFEMTVKNLLAHDLVGRATLLNLSDTLTALGHRVLITDYQRYYRLSHYLRRYTQKPIAILIGPNNLYHLFDEDYYTNLSGGLLEGFGRLFKNEVIVYVYPMARDAFQSSLASRGITPEIPNLDPGELVDAANLLVPANHQTLFTYLREQGLIRSIGAIHSEHPCDHTSSIRSMIRNGDLAWKNYVPPPAAKIIEERCLFTASN